MNEPGSTSAGPDSEVVGSDIYASGSFCCLLASCLPGDGLLLSPDYCLPRVPLVLVRMGY